MTDPVIINEQSGGDSDVYQSSINASISTLTTENQSEAKKKIGQFSIRPTTVVLLILLAVTAVGVSWFIYSQLYA